MSSLTTRWFKRGELSTLHFAFPLLLIGAVIAPAGPVAAVDQAPDPLALLRGVEAARQRCRSGRLEMSVRTSFPQTPKRSKIDYRLAAAFDGVSQRYDQYQKVVITKPSGSNDVETQVRQLESMDGDLDAFVRAGQGTFKDVHVRSAFDGIQFMQYSEDMGAYVKDVTKGTPDFIFDPRTLGLSVWCDINKSVADCLAYRQAKSITLVGREPISDVNCWHVHVVDSYGQNRHFWVGDDPSFRVYKCSFLAYGQRLEATSSYGEPGVDRTVPESVLTRKFDRSGQVDRLTEITVIKAEYNVAVDPKLWTLAGLGMPLGEMVIDERIHRVAGHFDGQGLTPRLPDAIRKGREAQLRPLHWGMVMTGLVLLTVLVAVVIKRRNWLREGEA